MTIETSDLDDASSYHTAFLTLYGDKGKTSEYHLGIPGSDGYFRDTVNEAEVSTLYCIKSWRGQTHFKNLAAFAEVFQLLLKKLIKHIQSSVVQEKSGSEKVYKFSMKKTLSKSVFDKAVCLKSGVLLKRAPSGCFRFTFKNI